MDINQELLDACLEAEELLDAIITGHVERAEIEAVFNRLQSATHKAMVIPVHNGDDASDHLPDTSGSVETADSGFTFWRDLGEPGDWYTWPISHVGE